MAYFSNGCEGEDFYNECSQCLNNEPCPIALVQAAYNYDACGNELATKILNHLVTQKDDEYIGCQMKPILDRLRDA